MTWLSLAYNYLTEFPEQLRSLTALEYVDLSAQRVDKVPLWVAELTSLKTCDLTWNKHLAEVPVPPEVEAALPGVFKTEWKRFGL